MDNRKVFFEELIRLAEQDDKIILIVPDVGFSFTEEFQQKFPDRYFNFGVTEQSCMIIAAALALSGYKPYVYSMINFVVFRPYEMVRNAVCYHNANVKILGVKGSEKYKFLGFSHNITKDEDIKVLESLPNMMTYTPETEDQTKRIMQLTYDMPGPAYIRL